MLLPTLYISARPNNQISIGRQNCIASKQPIYQSRQNSSFLSSDSNRLHRYEASLESVITKYKKRGNELRDKNEFRKAFIKRYGTGKLREKSPLDIILKSQRSSKAACYKAFQLLILNEILRALAFFSQYRVPSPKRFAYQSGQKIRECGAIIDMLCNGEPSHARVITLTLPASGDEAYACIAAYSGYAINRLFQKVRRKDSATSHWFFVWEHQKRGALHLHICLHNHDKELAKRLGDDLVALWLEILGDITNLSGVDLFFNADLGYYPSPENYQNINQEMRKSCGGYFSKYAAKSSKSEQNDYVKIFAQKYPPTRYWGSSQSVKDLINQNSFNQSITFKQNPQSEAEYKYLLDILLEFDIIQYSEYSFQKEIAISGLNGKLEILEVSRGFRQTFYLSPDDYQKILHRLRFEYIPF